VHQPALRLIVGRNLLRLELNSMVVCKCKNSDRLPALTIAERELAGWMESPLFHFSRGFLFLRFRLLTIELGQHSEQPAGPGEPGLIPSMRPFQSIFGAYL